MKIVNKPPFKWCTSYCIRSVRSQVKIWGYRFTYRGCIIIWQELIGTEAFIFEWKKSIRARICGRYIQRCRFAGVSIGHWTVISHKVPKQNKISQDQFQGCCNLNFGNCWAASYPDVTLQKRVFYYINLARAIGVWPGLVLCKWVSQCPVFWCGELDEDASMVNIFIQIL